MRFWIGFLLAISLASTGLAQNRTLGKRTGSRSFERFEAFSVPQERVSAALQNKINEEIRLLRGIVKKRKNPNSRAEILFRIGELYWTLDRSVYFEEMEEYNKKLDAFLAGRTKREPKEPKFRGDRSYKIYKAIIKAAPKYERRDEVLFLAGYVGLQLGDNDALKYFKEVTQKYKRSKFRLDAYMELGNHYFSNREFGKAITAYKTVLREPSKIYNFALYKLSWCYYNQGKVRSAMSVMQKVVKASKGVRYEIELREEALRDLVVFYSDLGLINQALTYFNSINEPEYGIKVLSILANIYFEQSRYKKAIATIRKLLSLRPHDEKAPNQHSRLIESYEKSQNLTRAMKEMERFLTAYEPKSAWYKKNTDVDARDYANTRAEVYARFLPKKFHERAQKLEKSDPKESKRLKNAALLYYKRYLDRFAKHKNAYDMRFLYAELLFQEKHYAKAANQFGLVVKADHRGRYKKVALVGHIDALSRLEESHFKGLKKQGIKKKNEYEKIKLSSYAKRLIKADETYVRFFPKDAKVPHTLLHRSQLFYNYNHFDRALHGFFQIVDKFGRSEPSITARHLILDIYNVRKDWENLEKWASTFLHHSVFANAENQAFLLKLIQGSIFQRAKDLEEKKKYVPAAEMYLRLANKYPKSPYADKAVFNAAVDYINADASKKARNTAQRFLREYPSSKLVPKMLLALAGYFDDKLDYAYAAYYYELLADKDPKSKNAADALYNAGLYREHLKHYAKALRDYDTYLERYKRSKDAHQIYFAKGLIFEKQRKWSEAIEIFHSFPRKYGTKDKAKNIEAYFRKGKAYDHRNKYGEAFKAYRTAIYLFNKYSKSRGWASDTGAKYAAQASFELTRDDYREFQRIKFRMPQRRLARAIEKKARLLKRLREKYLSVINFGDAEMGVAALYHIGKIYQNFSQALFNAPIPKGLNMEETQIYQQELENRAAPIEEKAVEAYEKGIKKAMELEVYTRWTKKTYDNLTQYKPDVYPPIRGITRFERHISEPLVSFDRKLLKGGKK